MEDRIKTNRINKEKFVQTADEHIKNTDAILSILEERLSKITGKNVELVNVNREYKECVLDLADYLEKENILFFNDELPFSNEYLDSFMRLFSVYEKVKDSLVRKYNKAVESVTSEEVIDGKLSQVIKFGDVKFLDKAALRVIVYSLNMFAKAIGSYSFEKYLESNDFRIAGINRYSNRKASSNGKYDYNRRLLEEDTEIIGKTYYSSAFDEWGKDFYSAALDADRLAEEYSAEAPKGKEHVKSN